MNAPWTTRLKQALAACWSSGPFSRRAAPWFATIGLATVAFMLLAGGYARLRLMDDRPVTYEDVREHFKYGSTGGERGWKQQLGFGIPYWVWIALPELFPEYLPDKTPGRGYASLGMIYEDGRNPRFDLPIGMSMRRVMGVDRVYFNCAVCHVGTVRDAPDGRRSIILGMPANVVNFGGVGQFIRQSANDWRFRSVRIMPKIEELAAIRDREYPRQSPGSGGYRPEKLSLLDRAIFKFVGVPALRDQLLALMGRLSFLDFRTWGPGRVDTFGPPKALLGFRMDTAHEREQSGVVDFPSIWNQKARKGMWLHWDGNNCSVDERNLSAAFGTGATPATLDREKVLRVADWIWEDAQPPAFPANRIDSARAAEGAPIYRQYCRSCHGDRERPFRAAQDVTKVGEVTSIDHVRTDEWRLNSYTPELARAQGSLYSGYPEAGEDACREYIENVCRRDQADERFRELRRRCYPARFTHFRKTNGYANQPLDGLWLRAPYLHNGSVPSVRALLEPSDSRPVRFSIGYDVYDYDNLGFVTSGPEPAARGWTYDTTIRGNSNRGHEGAEYGTLLTRAQKDALLEYLKTF